MSAELDSEPAFRPEQPRTGELFAGKYRVERVHQRSALGITIEALHLELEQRVAIRLLAADPAVHPEAAARFLRGARQAVQFQSAHSARIIDLGTLESGTPYFVTEFLHGSDLRRVLEVRGCLPVPEAVDCLLQACEALASAHARGIVHRNLKPANLFITRQGGSRRLVVLDFGVSEDPLSDVAINWGGIGGAREALAYLAPEQIREPSAVDARADIWALGAILHELLTGSPPFEAETTRALLAMIAADAPMPVSYLRPEIPAELESVVLGCLSKERDERYGSVAALANALRPFASAPAAASAGSRSTRPPPLPGQPTRAIVHVASPPQAAPSRAQPAPAARRLSELALTALGLAAAGALGVYITIRVLEGPLTAAVAPRIVVTDLSPALPAPATLTPLATPIAASTKPQPNVAQPTVAHVIRTPLKAQAELTRATAPKRDPIAEAKPSEAKRAPARGLFDDAN